MSQPEPGLPGGPCIRLGIDTEVQKHRGVITWLMVEKSIFSIIVSCSLTTTRLHTPLVNRHGIECSGYHRPPRVCGLGWVLASSFSIEWGRCTRTRSVTGMADPPGAIRPNQPPWHRMQRLSPPSKGVGLGWVLASSFSIEWGRCTRTRSATGMADPPGATRPNQPPWHRMQRLSPPSKGVGVGLGIGILIPHRMGEVYSHSKCDRDGRSTWRYTPESTTVASNAAVITALQGCVGWVGYWNPHSPSNGEECLHSKCDRGD
jgi:hypothetical protein